VPYAIKRISIPGFGEPLVYPTDPTNEARSILGERRQDSQQVPGLDLQRERGRPACDQPRHHDGQPQRILRTRSRSVTADLGRKC
jgi:hypothetical protein